MKKESHLASDTDSSKTQPREGTESGHSIGSKTLGHASWFLSEKTGKAFVNSPLA